MAQILPTAIFVGDIIAIPEMEWTTIHNRVKVVIQDQNIATQITQIISNYPALLTACKVWQRTIFSKIISLAVQTAEFSTQAATTLEKLLTTLKGLKPNDPVPESAKFIIKVSFGALAISAKENADSLEKLTPAIDAFITENSKTDEILEGIVAPLGPNWKNIAGPLGSLKNALANVTLGWSSITNDLQTASNEKITITTSELLALDIHLAINSWHTLANKATAFDIWASKIT